MADVIEKDVTASRTNLTVTGSTETAVLVSPEVPVPVQSARVLVKAWAQFTTGAGATDVTPRLRRGNGITGTLICDAEPMLITNTAGNTEPVGIQAVDTVANVASVQYSFTVKQNIGAADGTFNQGVVEVEVLNG